MPIRIMRDPPPDQQPLGRGEPPRIVVSDQVEAKSGQELGKRRAGGSEGLPSQTSWSLANCQCTVTGGSYVLAFRKEGDTFVLTSIDRGGDTSSTGAMDSIDGPFNWASFACPECGRTWTRDGGKEAPFPVIRCSCRLLFCTGKGLEKRKGAPEEEWWWHCPKCGIESHVKVGLKSLHGQALKGK